MPLPDATIGACRLSDAFAAPGSKITAAVEIENLGLASTPVDAGGTSTLGVHAIFVDDSGRERKVTLQTVPVLPPGESVTIELPLEVPHDPVLLRVILDPNPVDMDMSNNSRESFLGAPTPKSLGCAFDFQVKGIAEDGGEIEQAVARLSWTNAALYDEVRIYRDGSMVAALAGDATAFVDSDVAPGNHADEVRGVLGVSKSRRARCEVNLPEEPPARGFRRGDADSSGDLSITDGIAVLGYLFLGSAEPACLDAADTDDDREDRHSGRDRDPRLPLPRLGRPAGSGPGCLRRRPDGGCAASVRGRLPVAIEAHKLTFQRRGGGGWPLSPAAALFQGPGRRGEEDREGEREREREGADKTWERSRLLLCRRGRGGRV